MVCPARSPSVRVYTKLPSRSCQELDDILDHQEARPAWYYRVARGTIGLFPRPGSRKTFQIPHRRLASVPLDRSRYSPKLELHGICRTVRSNNRLTSGFWQGAHNYSGAKSCIPAPTRPTLLCYPFRRYGGCARSAWLGVLVNKERLCENVYT